MDSCQLGLIAFAVALVFVMVFSSVLIERLKQQLRKERESQHSLTPIQPIGDNQNANPDEYQSIKAPQNENTIDKEPYHFKKQSCDAYNRDDPLGLLSSSHGRLIPPLYLLSMTIRRLIRRLSTRWHRNRVNTEQEESPEPPIRR